EESRFEADGTASRRGPARSLAALLFDLASETGMLVRQEITLLRAELRENFARFGRGIGALAAGGLIAFSGWLVLLAAAVLGLSPIVAAWLAALIVGVVVLAFGAGLLLLAKSRLDVEALTPHRTLNSLHDASRIIRWSRGST